MKELKTNATILCNRTKTFCDYAIALTRLNTDKFKGTWTEIGNIAKPRSGFTKWNPMAAEGIALMIIQGIGSQIWLGQQNVWITNMSALAGVSITMEVWQHAFPSSGEKMAKKTEFGAVVEPGIALFWGGSIA